MEHNVTKKDTELLIIAIKNGNELIQHRTILTPSNNIEEQLNKALDALLW